jgi:membrane-associated phospholipid phosphatase
MAGRTLNQFAPRDLPPEADPAGPEHILRRHRAVTRRALPALLALALALGVAAFFTAYFPADLWFTRRLQQVRLPGFRGLMIAVSWLGYTAQAFLITFVAAGLLWWRRLKTEALCLLLSAGAASLLSTLIKLITARPRPVTALVDIYLIHPTNSFPSGHVVSYVAVYGFAFYLARVVMPRSWQRALLLALSGLMIALVGLSRVYLGAHWASDVVGGYLFGAVWLLVMINFYWRLKLRQARRDAGD